MDYFTLFYYGVLAIIILGMVISYFNRMDAQNKRLLKSTELDESALKPISLKHIEDTNRKRGYWNKN